MSCGHARPPQSAANCFWVKVRVLPSVWENLPRPFAVRRGGIIPPLSPLNKHIKGKSLRPDEGFPSDEIERQKYRRGDREGEPAGR